MLENYFDSKIPSFAKTEVYNFDATKETFKLYKELSEIDQEIDACRKRNS